MATGQLGTVVRHLQRLAGTHAVEDLADGPLLERFLRSHDEAAFATLVRRHGPLVLGVCRRLLRDRHLAEDAFQATFLVLLRRASSLDRRGSLAGWLYTVAYRVALKARAGAARHTGAWDAPEPAAPDAGGWDDLRPVLDEELGRLPEIYRLPVILCYLQGKSNTEAARQLGWPVGTVKGRLSRARELLRQRLTRRGIALGAALAAAQAGLATAAVPAALLRGAVAAAAGGPAPPAALALAEGALEVMVTTKLKCAAALALAFVLAAIGGGAFAEQGEPQKKPAPAKTDRPQGAVIAIPLPDLLKPQLGPDKKPAPGKELTVSGRVLNADGKPAAGARVTLLTWPGAAGFEVLAEVKADGAGKFRATVRPPQDGAVAAVATAPGHAGGWHWPCATDPVEIRLPRAEELSGRLVDLQGAAAAGVRVEVVRLGDGPGGSDVWLGRRVNLNRFVYESYGDDPGEGEEGTPFAEVPHRGGYLYTRRDAVEFYAVDAMVMSAGREKVVRMWNNVDRSASRGNALVLHGPPAKLPGWPEAVTTDAHGRFTLRGLPAGQGVGLLIRDPRYAQQVVSLPPQDKAKPGEFVGVLSPARTVEGVVTDALTGKPVPRARVLVDPPQGASGAVRLVSSFSRDGGSAYAIDLKGRPASAGTYGTQELAFALSELTVRSGGTEMPGLEAETDDQGRFKLSLFEAGSYRLVVAHPDKSYLPRQLNVSWPKREMVRQKLDVELSPAALVRGKVSEGSDGKAVGGARVDFWNKTLKLPDGVRYPRPVKTKPDGTFTALLPVGQWHLTVNAEELVYAGRALEVDRLVAGPVRVQRPGEDPAKEQPVKGAKVYPDGWAALDLKPGRPGEVKFELKRAPAIRGKVVGPDGKPAAGVKMAYRPVNPYASKVLVTEAPPPGPDDQAAAALLDWVDAGVTPQRMSPVFIDLKDGTFTIPVYDPKASFALTFLDAENQLAATAEVTGKQADGAEVTVTLRPCGSAKARFVGPDGKTLMNYRPLLFQLTGPGPVPVTKNVPSLIANGRWADDAMWAGHLDTQRHARGPKTDADGRAALPALVPGVTYRLLLSHGRHRDFTVEPGRELELGTLTVPRPHEMARMPTGKN